LLHFHRLSVGYLLFFGCHCLEVARSHVHKRSVLSAELLSHPFGAWHACRGGERHRAGCASLWLVTVEPLIGVPLTDDSGVVGHSLIDCASFSHQPPFFLCDGLQCSAALLTAESAWPLQIACMHRSTHAPHSTQHSTRTAHTHSEEDLHACIVIYEPCNRNGEICSRAVHPQ